MTAAKTALGRLGNVKAATKSIAAEVFEAGKAAGHDLYMFWGYGTSVEHKTGRALDIMVKNEAAGDWVRNYLWANRKRLRLQHVIWEQHITSTVSEPGVRRKMADRGDPTANHYDHNHALFFAGDYQAPVKETKPAKPKFVLKEGQLAVDGILGPQTIGRWQKIMGTPVDGEISRPKSALVEAVQRRLQQTVDHRQVVNGDGSEIAQDGRGHKTVGNLQRYLGSPVDTIIDKGRSNVVVALQRRLNTGRF